MPHPRPVAGYTARHGPAPDRPVARRGGKRAPSSTRRRAPIDSPALDVEPEAIRGVLAQMRDEFEARAPFRLREVEGGYACTPAPTTSDAVEAFLPDGTQTRCRGRRWKLAVVAYRRRPRALRCRRCAASTSTASCGRCWRAAWSRRRGNRDGAHLYVTTNLRAAGINRRPAARPRAAAAGRGPHRRAGLP